MCAFKFENYENRFSSFYKKFIEQAKTILLEEGIYFIDINTSYEFTDNPKTLFFDVVHTTQSGNEIIARIIDKKLNIMEFLD